MPTFVADSDMVRELDPMDCTKISAGMKLYGLLYPTLSLTLSPTIILVVVIPVITLDPIPTVPPVLTDVDLIVAIPSALNCSSAPPDPAIVTVGVVKYPNPLLPILMVFTVPATDTVTVAVACTGDGFPEKEILGATVYPRPIVAPVPTHHGSVVLLNPTAVTIPVIE